MSGWWQLISLGTFDFLFGSLLRLSPGVAIVAVAAFTSLVLVLARKWTTKQDWLRRARLDRLQLKRLIRTAKRERNTEALARYRETDQIISMKLLKQERLPLLLSLVPIAMVATWCFARVDVKTPADGEKVQVVVETPLSAVGGTAHIVPVNGLKSNGWVREIESSTEGDWPHGTATWRISGRAQDKPYRLLIRTVGLTVEHPLMIGRGYHEAAEIDHDWNYRTKVLMKPVTILGLGSIPGLKAIPPWMLGYLVLAIIFSAILKRLLRVR